MYLAINTRYFVSESTIDEFGISRYNIEVESFDVEPVLDDDIIEQNEVVAVKVNYDLIFRFSCSHSFSS